MFERNPPIFSGGQNLAAVLDRDWLGVDEAWMHMYLCRMFRHTLPQSASKLISWFRASQNGDGGFGFFPGTTSFVENCHYCLRALKVLEAEPDNPETARRFITSCQTASGGFGRGLRAAPFLNATFHAVAALALLNENQYRWKRWQQKKFEEERLLCLNLKYLDLAQYGCSTW